MNTSPFLERPAPSQEPSIKEYLEVLRKRKSAFIQVFVAVLVLGIVQAARNRPIYLTHAKLLVPSPSYSLSIVDSNNPIATMLAAAQPDSLATQLQVLQSEPFLEDAERKAGIVPKPGIAGPSPNVEAVEDSNVIQITVRGGDPGDIAKLANAMVDLHLERTNIVETIGLDDTIQFVRKEKEKAARDLATAERKLLAFRRDHRIVELTAKEESEAKAYVALQAKVHETESNIISAKAQIAELRARLAREPLDIVQDTVKENPRRARLEEKRDELKIQRVELLQDFLPASQRIRALDERIARATQQREAEPETVRVRIHAPNPSRLPLQTRLTELEADLQGHVAVHNAVVAQFDARKGVVDSLGPWEVLQSRLTHDRDAVQAAFATFSDRLRDLEIRSRARIRTARVIERAGVPTAPIRPPTTTNIAFSAILALCLATGVAFLLEHLDDRVHSPEDVERLSALPTLGNVPLIGPDLPRLLATLPAKSHAAEAYRTLRSSIGFAGADAPIRRLVVTSPSKGEGKTVTSVNLATAMAADGKKVILVDADLRRPSVHRLLDRPITPGLSEVLVARKSLEEALQDTDIENLRVICAGSIPPNPAELLGAQSFRALLRDLGERADVVIFDTPPCMPVTDPLIVAACVDGVVLVVSAGDTRKDAVRHAVELLTRAHARILGVVFNRVQPNKIGHYYHRYYYYYYGGGYYNDEAERSERHRRNGRERKLPLQNGARAKKGRGARLEAHTPSHAPEGRGTPTLGEE